MKALLVIACCSFAACLPLTTNQLDGGAGGGSAGSGGGSSTGLTAAEVQLLNARPYRMVVPDSYDGGSDPMPFVLLVHGYGASGANQDLYFRLSPLAQSRGFLLATPDGTLDPSGNRFWNVSGACCDWYHSGVDDVAYLTAVMDDVRLKYRVDEKRVFVMGHSNGAFMAHRLACELPDRIAGFMALAGDNLLDPSHCQPTSNVAALQVHGTFDTLVLYDGGTLVAGADAYPSAVNSVGSWAARQGCASQPSGAGADLDLEATLLGDETVRTQWANCASGAAELWSIQGASHIPTFGVQWPGAPYDFLMAHPKP